MGEKRASLAREFNVNFTAINDIVKNKTWKPEFADFFEKNNL